MSVTLKVKIQQGRYFVIRMGFNRNEFVIYILKTEQLLPGRNCVTTIYKNFFIILMIVGKL